MVSDSPSTPTRRQVLVAAVGVAAAGAASFVLLPGDAVGVDALGPVVVGDEVGGATVVAIHRPHLGAIPIVMRAGSGALFQVDVLARDPAGPAGIADTETLSLFLANQGDGATATDETQGLCVMALAGRLAEVERAPELLTLRERTAKHPEGSFGVPLT
jgi:hypothetical protein